MSRFSRAWSMAKKKAMKGKRDSDIFWDGEQRAPRLDWRSAFFLRRDRKAGPVKEIRVSRHRGAAVHPAPRRMGRMVRPSRAGAGSRVSHTLAWTTFGARVVGSVVYVASGLIDLSTRYVTAHQPPPPPPHPPHSRRRGTSRGYLGTVGQASSCSDARLFATPGLSEDYATTKGLAAPAGR